ncbi:LRRC7 protein, partial [Psilopogon haemacephalus]|nr:LRRC7 protein [Psilopogon haemacephalus]
VCCLEMTSKRKLIGRLVPCRCFRGEEEIVSVLDYSHCGLQQVPKEVFNFERTLEELYLDANQIEELPKVSRVLLVLQTLLWWSSMCPACAIGDLLAGGIQDFPENIKCCKCLTIIEASVNPVSK